MNAPEARVITTGPKFATVSVEVAACARCAAGRGCGAGLLRRGGVRVLRARVTDGLRLEPGDCVRLELAPRDLLRAAWLVYGLPLVSLVLFVAAATMSELAGDAGAIAIGAAGLGAGLVASRRTLRKGGCLQNLTPTVSERIGARHGVSGDAPHVGT